MALSKELEKLKYDKRLLEWNVERGHVSKADLKSYLDSLPDLAANTEQFSLAPAGGPVGASANGAEDDSMGSDGGSAL